ncbi:MAG TPA: PIN domain-containing protein [Candidatus Limnocylindria bacterium]|nr:PIN domain-containing protein [Candidatus Limnocylindria bacterium]
MQAGLVARLLTSFGLRVVAVTPDDGERAADLWTPGTDLSLADRLCLALGLRLDADVITADAAWASLAGGPRVTVMLRVD